MLATAGSTAAVAELARTLPPGARVAVEEPGYRRAVAALVDAGLTVVPAPVDEAGLVVDALPPELAAVYCTPAHQYPLGARLSAARRVALVERARAEGLLVIEDDYDGELRYDVAPLPLLAALGPRRGRAPGHREQAAHPDAGCGLAGGAARGARRRARAARRAPAPGRPGPGSGCSPRWPRTATWPGTCAGCGASWPPAGPRCRDAVTGAGGRVRGDAAGAHVVVPAAGRRAPSGRCGPRPRPAGWRWTGWPATTAVRPSAPAWSSATPARPAPSCDRALSVVTAVLRTDGAVTAP